MSEIASCRAVNVVSLRNGPCVPKGCARRMESGLERGGTASKTQHISAEGRDDPEHRWSGLCVLHYADGELQREAEIRVGEVPVRELLQACDPVGHRIAVNAQTRRRLVQAGRSKDRTQRI